MSVADWVAQPVNWAFTAVALLVVVCAARVVTAKNVVHSALYLMGALVGTAALFLLLGAEFVAWVLVLVYIGAVIVLFLFGIMITTAPTGRDENLSSRVKVVPALLSLGLFVLLSWASVNAFGDILIAEPGEPIGTEVLGQAFLGRYVIPFEVVGFLLLAALVGGVTIARRDLSPAEEEEK